MVSERKTNIPLRLERFYIHKLRRDNLIGQYRLVLLQQTVAYLGVVGFLDGIFQICLFELVECDYDTEYFSKGVLQVALSSRICKFDFLVVVE